MFRRGELEKQGAASTDKLGKKDRKNSGGESPKGKKYTPTTARMGEGKKKN